MSKNFFTLMIAGAYALVLACFITACNKDEGDEHQHEHHAIEGHAHVYGYVQDTTAQRLADVNFHAVYALVPAPGVEDTVLRDGNRFFSPFPNPVEEVAHLRFELGQEAHIHIAIHSDETEEEIEFLSGHYAAGVHDTMYDVSALANGLYHFHLEVGLQELHRTILKNTPNDGRLDTTPPLATSEADGDYECNVLVGDSIDMYSGAALFLGKGALEIVGIIALKPGYVADPVALMLQVDEVRNVNITMHQP